MAFNGAGVFVRLRNFVQDKANGIKIRADHHDSEHDDFASGLSNCVTRDGQTTITADLPMNSHKLTGLSEGTGAGHSVRYEQIFPVLTITHPTGGTSQISLVNTDAGASGPVLELYHQTASPAANDEAGTLAFYSLDSAANKELYASIVVRIDDATSTSEDGRMTLRTKVAGTEAARFYIGSGMVSGDSPTGADIGTGTINVGTGYYTNGNRVSAHSWGYVVYTGATPALTDSHNIASITDTSTGVVDVTIATDHGNDTYAALATAHVTPSATVATIANKAAGSFRVNIFAGAVADISFTFATFGD